MRKEFYTIKELADLLVLSESHIRNLVHADKIPSVKVLGSVRIRVSDVEKMIKPKEVKEE